MMLRRCNTLRLCNMAMLLRKCNREKPEQRDGIRGMRIRLAYHSSSRSMEFLAVRDFAYNAYPLSLSHVF
jgi:hypothetical protein